MMSKLLSIFLVLLAVSALCSCEEAVRDRVKRRVKPRPKKPLTLEELRFECQMHGWQNCRQKTSELLDKTSNISVEHRKCLTSAVLARVSSLSVNPLVSLQPDDGVVAADVPVPGANEASQTLTGNNGQPQTSEESSEACTLNAQSKETAREHYCDIFTHSSALFVFNYMEDDMYNRGLTGLAKCVNFYDSNEIFTPDEIITSLRAWYEKMVRLHDCCTRSYQGFFNLPETSLTYPCPSSREEATNRWDNLLSGVAVIMKKAELLESLGRRKQCLRGCVGIEEVKCCDI